MDKINKKINTSHGNSKGLDYRIIGWGGYFRLGGTKLRAKGSEAASHADVKKKGFDKGTKQRDSKSKDSKAGPGCHRPMWLQSGEPGKWRSALPLHPSKCVPGHLSPMGASVSSTIKQKP